MRTICLNQEAFQLPESVATIGVFDGVHAGHQLLIRMVRDEARKRGLCSVVITFDCQPRQILDPTFQPQVLTTLEEKRRLSVVWVSTRWWCYPSQKSWRP